MTSSDVLAPGIIAPLTASSAGSSFDAITIRKDPKLVLKRI